MPCNCFWRNKVPSLHWIARTSECDRWGSRHLLLSTSPLGRGILPSRTGPTHPRNSRWWLTSALCRKLQEEFARVVSAEEFLKTAHLCKLIISQYFGRLTKPSSGQKHKATLCYASISHEQECESTLGTNSTKLQSWRWERWHLAIFPIFNCLVSVRPFPR